MTDEQTPNDNAPNEPANDAAPFDETAYDDYVHGLLPPERAERLERFCETDDDARAALAAARDRAERLRSLPPVEAPESLVRATMDGITGRETRRAGYRRWFLGIVGSVTVASLLLVSGLHLYYASLKASPYDVRLLGQRELLAGSRASVRLAVWDAESDRPLAGVPVRLALHMRGRGGYDRSHDLGEATTDAHGIAQPVFDLPDWEGGVYELKVVADTSGTDEALVETVTLVRSSKLMLSTDKPLYKPGQTIHVRALSLRRPDLQPVAGEAATFSISDPKGNVVFKQSTETSEFGITSTDCPLATEIIEGSYTIDCTIGDTTSSVTVAVEKYVLPKFALDVTLDEPFYAPGDRVGARLHAGYFFGQPVAGAEVTFVAEIEAAGTKRIHESTATTDAAGDASVEFDLPEQFVGLERNAGDASFRLVAQVKDTAGQQQATAATRIVTNEPIRIEVVPEMGRLVDGVANEVYLFTSRADGQPARTRIRVTGLDEAITTSRFGVASFEITPRDNEVRLTVVATEIVEADVLDPVGKPRVGRRHVVLDTERIARDFVLRTDRAVYTGGESMTVRVLGGGVEPVFLDFLKDGQTVLTRTIDVSESQGTATFDLPPELFGTLQLCAYRFGEHGLPVVKLRTVQVNRAGELTIAAKLNRETYRPGDEAEVEFTLTDADGRPVPGALSLAAVDEAVFHVLKQRPGLEGTFFQLERELLEPVYAIYGGWSPGSRGEEAVPVAERIEFEQALFARTTRVADEVAFDGKWAGEPVVFESGMDDLEPDFGEAAPFEGELDPFGGEDVVSEFSVASGSPLTLAVTSYPAKKTAMLERQRDGLRGVRSGWQWFIGWTVFAALAVFAVFLFKAFLITMGTLFAAGTLFVVAVSLWSGEPFSSVGSKASAEAMAADMDMWGGEMGAAGAIAPSEADLPLIADPGDQPVRVRRSFPETLLWRPELVTDDAGRATLTVPLADSITTWRMTASAVSGDGRLGALEEGIRVFQPFFVDLDLPVALVRRDEVAVPVVVYNYLDEPQMVELELANGDWFELLDAEAGDEATIQRIELAPGEVRSTHYRLRAENVGTHRLQVTARANGVADALEREIAVLPDGRPVETVVNGALDAPATVELAVPEEAIPGSVTAVVKLYPSGFSQLVEGLDGIFRKPYGCFEQTSSTTYPNVLALQYLRETGQAVPEVEAKARQYVHLGYQRLLGFEIDGGGFDWFGNPPANVTLTAYGLLEFEDMARVHDVDPRLIERTRRWLLSKRELDGSWKADRGMLDDGLAGAVQRGADLDLSTTAYVAWAVFRDRESPLGRETLDFLLAHRPETIDDPYTLALVVNAIRAIDRQGREADPYVARLLSLRKSSEDGKQTWWELAADRRTNFYGDGDSGNVEVTALAALALLETKANPAVVSAALTWLVAKKGSDGTWPSTQATVLALQALVRGTSAPLGGDDERSFRLLVDGEPVKEWTVPADQAEVLQQVNLSQEIADGTHEVRIEETTGTGTGYQIAFRYHVPEATPDPDATPKPLSIDLAFDRTDLAVSDTIVATARVRNNTAGEAPMVIVDLPIPAGFRLDPIELEELVASGDVAKYQVNARTAVVYLRSLAPGATLELKYRLEATMPVKLTVPPATVYEYYTPDRRGRGKPLEVVVGPRA